MGSHKPSLLYVEIKRKLIELIASMNPHDRLPSRNELVMMYKVARTTIERAVSELIGEGYLYARDGSGTFVAETQAPVSNVKGSSATWGLVIPSIMHDVYPALLRAVEDVANQNGVHLIVCNTDNHADKQTNYINKLIDAEVQGLVIVPVVYGDVDTSPFKRLTECGIPYVFCNRGVFGVEAPLVTTNNYYGAYMAVKALLQSGYRRISYVSSPLYATSLERYKGYISALGEAGIQLDENLVVFGDSYDHERQGYLDAVKLLAREPRPDSFFCFNDQVAAGVYRAVVKQKLVVGQDVGLVGYGNNHVCEKLPVQLSSVDFDSYHIGIQAVEILLSLIAGVKENANKMIILHPKFVSRESSNRGNISSVINH